MHLKNEVILEDDLVLKRNCLVIIDDDEISSSVLKLFAGNFFKQIVTFTSTEEAIPFMSKHAVDMIIAIIISQVRIMDQILRQL